MIKKPPLRAHSLSDEQITFLIESGDFSREEIAESQASIARGELAEEERKTRQEAINASLNSEEVAPMLAVALDDVDCVKGVQLRNPFKPTAGCRPPLLVGRGDALEGFRGGLEDGPGAPGLLTLFTGARGVGKTVMLAEAEDVAVASGWAVFSDTATPGLVGRLTRGLRNHLNELENGPTGRRINSVIVGGFGIASQRPDSLPDDLRAIVTELTTLLAERDAGLVITVDEIHAIDRAELTDLAATVQHLIREELPVGLLIAGIPKSVSDLLNDDSSSFLRKADRIDLREVPVHEVQEAFASTFAETSVAITDDQLELAAAATDGYPALIQLVGYQVWRRSVDGGLTDVAVEEGIDAARRQLGSTVLQASLADLSQVDRTFLLRMAEDDGPSRLRDLAERLGASKEYVGTYRRRLIDAGIAVDAGRGYVTFAVPHLRQYLREHSESVRGIR